ncbi:M60 family metallopeptidase [Pedobacter sp. ASV28]|uniref:M60 family metallopeptidase n=1 Tax=Pedobacter sp. ASV28 TaxID=2795123 RepID=UPI0018ECA6D6|nr:M60 family metallopeptidase [Pedobacter sp. ASV28]
MKFYKLLTFSLLLTGIIFSGCKKYGYDFADGYDDASGNPQAGVLDTNMAVIDRSAYAKARLFPGLVDVSEPRLTDSKFTLDLNFANQTKDNLRIQEAPEPQFSTGYYAAPGELIKIIVPAGVNGLSMQIGCHTDNLTGKPVLLRDPVITARKALYPGVNYMRNLYGGHIYIRASFAIPQPVEFTISGAVASPDFILDQSNHTEWKARVLASKVPWLELRSKYVIFTVPRDKIVAQFTNAAEPLNDMAQPLRLWSDVFRLDYNGWMGLSDNAANEVDRSPQSAWRGVLDIQLSAGYGHSGFPFVGQNDSEWFGAFTSVKRLTTSELTWGAYHEFGHNCQQPTVWSWSTLGETTNNLFSFKVAKRINANYSVLHAAVNSGFPQALAYAATAGSKNFDTDAAMNDPFKRMTPFVQIFEQYGYGAMTYLYTEARHAKRLSNNDQDKRDFVFEKLCDYTGTNLIAFFQAWGILISPISENKVAALGYPLLNKAIWTYNPLTKTGGTGSVTYATSVVSVSSNASGDGTPGALVDGIISAASYWHSNYSTATPTNTIGFPINIILSTGTPVAIPVKGMTFAQRQNNSNGYVKDLEVFVSNDNVTYTSVGTYTMAQNIASQIFTFPGGPVNARYVKVVIKSGVNTDYVSMSECNIIKQ